MAKHVSDFSKGNDQIILGLVNEQNGRQFKSSDINFQVEGAAGVKSSQLRISAKNGSGFKGSKVQNYDRIHLNELEVVKDVIVLSKLTTVDSVIADINETFGVNMASTDVLINSQDYSNLPGTTTIDLTAGGSIVVTAKDSNLVWVGTRNISITNTDNRRTYHQVPIEGLGYGNGSSISNNENILFVSFSDRTNIDPTLAGYLLIRDNDSNYGTSTTTPKGWLSGSLVYFPEEIDITSSAVVEISSKFNLDNTKLAVHCNNTLYVWDITAGAVHSLKVPKTGRDAKINFIDLDNLVLVSTTDGTDIKATVFDITTGAVTHEFVTPGSGILYVSEAALPASFFIPDSEPEDYIIIFLIHDEAWVGRDMTYVVRPNTGGNHWLSAGMVVDISTTTTPGMLIKEAHAYSIMNIAHYSLYFEGMRNKYTISRDNNNYEINIDYDPSIKEEDVITGCCGSNAGKRCAFIFYDKENSNRLSVGVYTSDNWYTSPIGIIPLPTNIKFSKKVTLHASGISTIVLIDKGATTEDGRTNGAGVILNLNYDLIPIT